jgi:hypothetical protein
MRHSAAFSQEIGLQLVFAIDSGSYDMEKKARGDILSVRLDVMSGVDTALNLVDGVSQ